MSQYIRADRNKQGKEYFWLVESHREGERVVQKRIRYLGTQKPDLVSTMWGHTFGASKRQEATATEKKPATTKPPVPSTTEGDNGLLWLLG